jgi:hypothetical protein
MKSIAEIVAQAGGCEAFLVLLSKTADDRLRDTFALAAFTVYLEVYSRLPGGGAVFPEPAEAGKLAYHYADALMEARRR